MKKFFALLFSLALFAAPARAGNGDLKGLIVDSSGVTYGELTTPFAANGILAFGAAPGALVTVSLANYATTASLSSYATVSTLSNYVTTTALASALTPYALASAVPDYRCDDIVFTVAGGVTKTITFSTPITNPSNWRVFVQTQLLTTSVSVSNITTTTFTVTLPAAISGTMPYYAAPKK